jgi:hypothetical protein
MSDLPDLDTQATSGALLDRTDLASPTWRKIKAHMEAKQAELRAKNDDPAKDAIATALLRGELRGIRNLLALGNPSPAVQDEHGDA